MTNISARKEVEEPRLSPHQAPLLERLTSQDEDHLEDELNQDLGYLNLGSHHHNWVDKATDRGSSCLGWFRRNTRGRYEDWLFLILLGSLMGLYSFGIDVMVKTANQYRLEAFLMASDLGSRVVIWFILTAAVSTTAALFLAWFIPTATGSGFPEIKAYLQGVKMENTFSPITCFGKVVFLPVMLCTALPLGKEGPVTHVAAIFALFITKVFKDISVDELERHTGNELVAAACTMGAAVCYGAPVGGVLFSIEATRSYFAVRNYWRGFFAAVCGTIFYKGLSQIYHGIDILPMYQETYTLPLPFSFEFLGISIAIGLVCGLIGPAFVWTHRHLVKLTQRLTALSPECGCGCCSAADGEAKQTPPAAQCSIGLTRRRVTVFRVVYTVAICVLISAVSLPWKDGYSPLMSHISNRQQLTDLLMNVSWEALPESNPAFSPPVVGSGLVVGTSQCAPGDSSENCTEPAVSPDGSASTATGTLNTSRSQVILARWTDNFTMDYRAVLILYMLYYCFGMMVCTTLTLPSGSLIPLFKAGVALGRLVGEFYCANRLSVCLANSAVPSGFACMWGAALCASVTHSISISVIVFELTGQITYVLPVLTSVLVANALSRHLQPSMIDSLIKVKKITVLPKMVLSKISGGYANVTAKDLMMTDFLVVTKRATLNSLRKMVRTVQNPAKVLPLVDDEVSMEPLGLVHVRRIRRFLREELGEMAWQRDKPRFYVSSNVFKSLDWDSVRGAPAVGQLDLEVSHGPRSTAGAASPQPQRPRSSSVGAAGTGIDPSTYCTVHQDKNKIQWDLKRQKLIMPKAEIDLSSQPKRSALKTSVMSPGPLTPVEEVTQGEQEQNPTKVSRFMIKKVPERSSSAERMPLMPLKKQSLTNGHGQNGTATNGVSSETSDEDSSDRPPGRQPQHTSTPLRDGDAPQAAGDSGASSDDPTTDSVSKSPLGGGTGARRRSGQDGPRKASAASAGSEVYDSLVSESSRAARLRDGIAKMMPKRTGNVDLEMREHNAHERLNRQFSLSDLHQGQGEGISNMSDLIQRTLDRTTLMLSGIKNGQRDPSATQKEVRLRRAWRRRQLNREVELRDVMEVDTFPLAVNVDTPLVQVHKMFAMLCANKMYVMDRRRLVGCLPLQRLSEFITRGHVEEAPKGVYDTITAAGPTPLERSGSQDTLDDIDDSVYDTILEPPADHPPPAATSMV